MKDYYWLNDDSRKFLERGYLLAGETAEQRIRDIGDAAERWLKIEYYSKNIDVEWWYSVESQVARLEYLKTGVFPDIIANFSDKFVDYMARGFYSLSSPIWSNFGRDRGLPISCFGSDIPDTMEGILGKLSEIGMMTKMGGGTSANFGNLRGRGTPISSGGESTGSVHFMDLFETLMNVVSQGNVRRGSFAAYLPIDHPDILEFLQIRNTDNSIQNMSIGVSVSDEWMESMKGGDTAKRKVWGLVIKKRFETGYPYIFFSDNANNGTPEVYRDSDEHTIKHSNLCSEIMLPNNEEESFVCDLSSLNLARWDELKDTDAIEVMTMFLDAVMSEFIDKTDSMPYMDAPRTFAIGHRAIGIGVLGWHSYLQSKSISFESMDAMMLNGEIWETIKKRSYAASTELGNMLGFAPVFDNFEDKRRNTTTMAIAPTTSSSFILGQVSPSVEPLNSNYFTKDLAKGKFTFKNPTLKEVLNAIGEDIPSTWKSILTHGGSVQHLDCLTDHEKEVFKTFGEISQKQIVTQAGQRQKYIDQGQSINLMIPPNISPKEVNELMMYAHEIGLKSLYYQRSANPAQELARSINTCTTCES